MQKLRAVRRIRSFRTARELLEHFPPPKPQRRSPKSGDGTLTIDEVASRYGVKTETVRAWISSGELKATNVSPRLGRRQRLRVSVEELAIFEQRRTVGPQPKVEAARRRSRGSDGVLQYF